MCYTVNTYTDITMYEGMKNMFELTCQRCGNEYTSKVNRAGYCPDCRIERQKERNREYLKRKNAGKSRTIGAEDVCQKCGKSYIIKTGSQVLCDDCIDKGVRLTRSAANTKYRDNNYDTVYVYVPKGEKENLKEYAKNHDMSLNEFVNFAILEGKKTLDKD